MGFNEIFKGFQLLAFSRPSLYQDRDFPYVESTMKGSIVRTIGMTRTHFLSWLTVFCYNVA
ncbi:hypothetical protein, partial [Sutterella seckii]|uniref:hypothetical protein n=1 Tax=Sutterella seckii TaxID=1944635 RepID=UPI001D049B9B